MTKTKAAEVLQLALDLGNWEFNSEYTSLPKTEWSITRVKSLALFNDLTEDERLHFSTEEEYGRPVLSIYNRVWVKVLDGWHLILRENTFNSQLSFNPEFIFIDDTHVLHVESLTLYQNVTL